MKQKLKIAELHNDYYVQRHGESTANIRRIIVSDPQRGKRKEFGLTTFGKSHARGIAGENECALGPDTVIITSPFSRAKDTAKITADVLGVQKIIVSWRLKERYFGCYEGTTNANYQKVWDDDKKNPNHRNHGGESVNDVLRRVRVLITKLENNYTGKKILFVTHGDTGQITTCFFQHIAPRHHRKLEHLKTGEIRKLSR